jgi:hypothetical protein
MGLLMNIVLGIAGAAIASAILSIFGIALGGWVGSDLWIYRRVFADLDLSRATGPHGMNAVPEEWDIPDLFLVLSAPSAAAASAV